MEPSEVSITPTPNVEFEAIVGDATVVFVEDVPDFSERVGMDPEIGGPIRSDFFDEENDWRATKIGETVNGKTVQIMKEPETPFYRIAFAPGGELPKELQGSYTSYDRAEQHARIWLSEHYAQAADASTKS
jgi:hypothetical protein